MEEKLRKKTRIDLTGSLMSLPVGGCIRMSILTVSKESVRATCSQLKSKYGVSFSVKTQDRTSFNVTRNV